jgi:branched-chain amino acid transport system substrate-binding protein
MRGFKLAVMAAAMGMAFGAQAADKVTVGMLSTLSGPGAGLGVDIRDGFNLALKHLNGKLGGLPAEVIVADDQQKPDVAQQTTEKFLKKNKVDFMTGIVDRKSTRLNSSHNSESRMPSSA